MRAARSASRQRDTPGHGNTASEAAKRRAWRDGGSGMGRWEYQPGSAWRDACLPTQEGRRRRDIARGPGDRLRGRAARERSGGAGPAICDRRFIFRAGSEWGWRVPGGFVIAFSFSCRGSEGRCR